MGFKRGGGGGGGEEKKERKKEKKDWRENTNLKTLFYKDCSLGSVKKLTTSPY